MCIRDSQENHHELESIAVRHMLRERSTIVGGQLGRPSGARFRTYERLQAYTNRLNGTLWQSRLSTTRFPSQVEWQEIFVPALEAVRSQVLSQSDRARIQFNCQLHLPAAFALGFNFNIRVAGIGVWARRTGVSDFKQQFWLSDAQYAEIDFPVKWFERPRDGDKQSAIVELTSYDSIHASVGRFANQSGINLSLIHI